MKKIKKYKVCRRLGTGVFNQCQTDKFTLSETKRNAKRGGTRQRRKSLSEYGMQLLEKQKIKMRYGVNEKQFRFYVEEASAKSKGGDSGVALLKILESRLDNVVYRLGLAPTRRAARQLVAHGHIVVNGRKNKIPSYLVKQGDMVSVRDGSKDKKVFAIQAERAKEHRVPEWLMYDMSANTAEIKTEPTFERIDDLNLNYIFEYYSR